MVNTRAWQSADDFVGADATEILRQSLSRQTPPVGTHTELQGGMCEDSRCPLDSMDLGRERGVYQTSFVEDFVPAQLSDRFHINSII